MASTLRERHWLIVPLGLWILATVLCTIAGPFGTHAALGVSARLAYWAGVTALSVLGSIWCIRIDAAQSLWGGVLIWGGFSVVLAVLVHGLNSILFADWHGIGQFGRLLLNIGVTVAVVHGAIGLARRVFQTEKEENGTDPQTAFLRRLPIDKRAPLIRLEAQDHYLNVVTKAGSALLLMRLQDAVEALAGLQGLQVHRSHWVALSAVAAHRRDKGRDFLVLANGDEVPISRSFRPDVKAAGLI